MKFWTILTLGLVSLNALALPILTESEDGSGRLATIYPDHENPNKVYFAPNRGGLLTYNDGTPQFSLVYWGKNNPGNSGGLMTAMLGLSIGKDLQEAINAQLAMKKAVAVLPVQSSYIDFVSTDEKPIMQKYFEEIDVSDVGGRFEDSIGVMASLTNLGTKTLPFAFKSGGTAANLNYCYQLTGVSPVFNAKIQLNYNKVYTHFLAQASTGKWFWKAKIRTEVEKLVEDKTIKITINGGDANKYDYIMTLADKMVEKFFEPQLQNRRNSAGGRIGISFTKIIEDRDMTYTLTQREIIKRDYCVSLDMGAIKNYPELIVDSDKAE
jgi:hypothetical protein